MSNNIIELCVGCGRVLPEDNGFSNLCDVCNPAEPIIPAVPPIERVAPAPSSYIDIKREPPKERPALRLVHSTDTVEEIVARRLADEEDSLDESLSREELIQLKQENLEELGKIKQALLSTLPQNEYVKLKNRALVLGRMDQRLAIAIRVKKSVSKVPPETQQQRIKEDQIRTKDFLGYFYEAARTLLSSDAFGMLVKVAQEKADARALERGDFNAEVFTQRSN